MSKTASTTEKGRDLEEIFSDQEIQDALGDGEGLFGKKSESPAKPAQKPKVKTQSKSNGGAKKNSGAGAGGGAQAKPKAAGANAGGAAAGGAKPKAAGAAAGGAAAGGAKPKAAGANAGGAQAQAAQPAGGGAQAQAAQPAAAKPKAKPKAKAKAAKKPKSAQDAVQNALSALGEDGSGATGLTYWDDSKPDAESLRPIEVAPGKMYHPRPVGSISDVEMLRTARENEINVLFSGYPGTGKTALVKAAFPNVITVNGNADFTGEDFKGSWKVMPDNKIAWEDGPLVRAMKQGEVLFVDDCTLISPNVISVLYPMMDGQGEFLLTEHEGEKIVAQPGFYICGAHNPDAPGAMLAEALSSRFGIHFEIEGDLVLALDMGVDNRIVRVAAQLRKMRTEGLVTWAPEMRELLTFRKNAEVFGERIAVNNLIRVAPEDARDEVAKSLKEWFGHAEPLTHTVT